MQYTVIQVYAPTTNDKEDEVEQFYEGFPDLTPRRVILFITGHWNAKVGFFGMQKIPGITGKFGLGVQNEARQRLREFCQENAWSQETPSSNNTRDDHEHHFLAVCLINGNHCFPSPLPLFVTVFLTNRTSVFFRH